MANPTNQTKQKFGSRLFSKRKNRQLRKIDYFSVASDTSAKHDTSNSDSEEAVVYPMRSSTSQRQLNSDGSSVDKLHDIFLKVAAERAGNTHEGVPRTLSHEVPHNRFRLKTVTTDKKDISKTNFPIQHSKAHFAVRTREVIVDDYNDENVPDSVDTSDSSARNSPERVQMPLSFSSFRYEMNDSKDLKVRKTKKSRRSSSRNMNTHAKNVILDLATETGSAASMSSCSMDSVLDDPMRLEYEKYKLSKPKPPPPPSRQKSEETDDSSFLSRGSCKVLESWGETYTMAKTWFFGCISEPTSSRYS